MCNVFVTLLQEYEVESDNSSMVGEDDPVVIQDGSQEEDPDNDLNTDAASPQSPRGPTPPPDEPRPSVSGEKAPTVTLGSPKSVPTPLKKKASENQSKRSNFAFSPGPKKGGVVKRSRKMDDMEVQEIQRTEAIQKMATVVQGALEPKRQAKDENALPDPHDSWWKVIKDRMSRMTPEVNLE